MPLSISERVVELIRREGILRPRDLDDAGISRVYLRRLQATGAIESPGRGLYVLPGSKPSAHWKLALACKRMPKAVVCLHSALHFHGLLAKAPPKVWMAIVSGDRCPQFESPPVRIVRFSRQSISRGVERARIDGVRVRITSPAKTVADCFKYRNKIGPKVALKALSECWRQRRASMKDLVRAAEVCRVARIMAPYLEALT